MALIKFEGFDHETSAADLYAGILSTVIVVGANQTATVSLTNITQYSTGQSLAITGTNSTNGSANVMAIMPFTPAGNSVIVGAAVSLSASIGNGAVLGFVNASLGQLYCYISAGALKVFRGDPTLTSVQLGSTVNSAVASLGWAYIEMKVVVDGSAGSVIVQINGSTIFNQTGLNTSNDGTTGVTGVLLGTSSVSQTSTGFTSYFDDVYASDTSGISPYNGFLGPVRVITQFPIANGSVSNFTGLAHHANWQNVSESEMDSDATYNFSNQTGSIDSFVSGALPGSASAVYAVKVTAAGRIDDSGIRTVQTYLKSGSTVAVGANVNMVGSYQYFSDLYTIDPNNIGAWTPSSVNLLQFGYKIVPSPGSPVAFAALTIIPNFIGVAAQFSNMSGLSTVGPFVAIILTVAPTLASATRAIGPITAVGSAQQGVNLTMLRTLTITASGGLSPGLQASGLISIGMIIPTVSLLQIVSMSATVSILPVWTAGINQGLAAVGIATLHINAQSALSQTVSSFGSAILRITPLITSVQSNQLAGSGRIGALSAVASASGAKTSNIHIGLSAWVASHSYTAGNRVSSTFGGVANAYQALTTGLSGSTQPNGTSSSFSDGTLTWKYLSHIDFADLTSWEAAIPATLTQPIVGLLWNNGTITTTAGTAFVNIGNSAAPRATTAINTITLRPAPGEGIRDSLIGGTLALSFNASKGVSFTLPSGIGGINYVDINDSNVILTGLQFRDPLATSGSTIIQQENSSTAFTLSNCIIDGFSQQGGANIIVGGTGKFSMINCLVIDRTTAAPTYASTVQVNSANTFIVNCTIVALNNPGSFCGGIIAQSTASIIRNTIVMGYTAGTAIAGGGGPVALVDHCLFDQSTAGTAAVDSGGNLFSKLVANQFTSATTDFRLKVGADALNVAVTDTTNLPTADDIAGNHRPAGIAWDIGAWE